MPTLVRGVIEEVLSNGLFRVDLDGVIRTCYVGSMLRRVGVTMSEGDRVTVRTESDGVFRGEITQVRPALEPRKASVRRRSKERTEGRVGLIAQQDRPGLKPQDQRIDRSLHPEWATVAESDARSGDGVYCTAGPATIHRLLGKTGNGSRLLKLRLAGQPRASFFAAASNVLLEPQGATPDDVQTRGAAAIVIG
jgi:translation initiation factor IF-1